MNTKYLGLFLLTLTTFTCLHSMDKQSLKPTLSEHAAITIPDVWLNIIAQCSQKWKLRETCKYLYVFASVRNKEIFLHDPSVLNAETLKKYALYYAYLDDGAFVHALLDRGLDPNTQDSGSKLSLLHYAINNGNLSLSETLLKHPDFIPANATIEEINDCNGCTASPFKLALKRNQLAIAKCILTIDRINLDEVLGIYQQEASDSNIDILIAILSMKKIDRQKLSELLYKATCRNQVALVTLLLKQKDIDIHSKMFNWNRTSLCEAVNNNNMRIAKLLIEHGARLDNVLNYVQSAHSMRFLIDQGASLNVKNLDGETLLAQTINYDHAKGKECADIIQLLLERGTDINEIVDNDGNVALGLIANRASSCYEAIKVLLAHPDIDIHIKNKKGKTPLTLASEERDHRRESSNVHRWDYLINQIEQHKKA